ncbi:glutamate synthase large subunit [Brenneria populi]|uniref:Glutamate synthase large subunit n=1 Tax=Brenneria populi TaxID=1505588 RepID=A0ABU6JPK0_9GAMM|nr:glutamate synthase large subunit [Brenneria populi Li et al. 2015]
MLYDASQERDNCGFGLIAHIEGEPSHKVVRTAIHALARMQHRGAILADGKTGDGCGLLLQKPDRFFRMVAEERGWRLAKNYSVGMMFLNQDEELAQAARRIVEEELQNETLSVLGWREVPTNPDVLGEIALSSLPRIEQIFVNAPAGWLQSDMERRLFMARRRIEKRIEDKEFYVCSFSNLVTIYKGLCMPADLPRFYLDLADLRLESAICLFHQRFSTNTVPRWPLAQPFRYLAHNGEINTIAGNRQWARARAYKFKTPLIPDLQDASPFVNETGSDSSSLDNMLELFLSGGMDIIRAMRLLVPPAWQNNPDMDPELRAFFDFNSMHMEPWDGPAGIVMSDGRYAACNLDRNGLRPARYVITKDKLITCASEVGIWDYQPDEVVEKGRVGPGELMVIDTRHGRILHSAETDDDLKSRHPYKTWMEKNVQRLVPFEDLPDDQVGSREFDDALLETYQKQFGYSAEELDQVLRVLGENGQEATGSMGDDTPFAVLSSRPRIIYDYFRQQFAQVTNPPIDPLREAHVMSLATCIGREMNVFCEAEGQAHRLSFKSPILLYSDFKQLISQDQQHYRADVLDLTFEPEQQTLQQTIERLCDAAEHKVRDGAVLLVLSDRAIAEKRLPVPAPMAVGAIQRRLVEKSLRCDANLIVETASARDPHHFAVLLGFGATAIYPYLAYETLARLVDNRTIDKPYRAVMLNYRNGINKGLYKIMSKMGISTVASYRCSQLFEAVGLHKDVSTQCFQGVVSRIGGASFSDFEQDLLNLSKRAWLKRKALDQGGLLKFVHGGEYHAYNPDVVTSLQAAVKSGEYSDYERYSKLVNQRPAATLRDLLALKPQADAAIAIDDVEPATEMFKRFDTAAMSIGALSPEAHESLAEAMNGLGGFSNSGEGGEDPARYRTNKVSRIKQVASGRFGVTPAYLVNADVIQIKVAQGAKPGEGGQLPGDKVTPYIARLRYSVPGVTLISPPPHHDIYSIEDLAQLIFDLKQINPKAMISVKLVSEPGVGTIATGVAKAYADLITIAGYDGGTGASPLTSVKYAGCPWELGLVETQQALVANGLRHKIRLQVDGGLKTGLDIIKAAILGAESFGFGTGPMVALGCKYLRICHLNNCATGVATQDEKLRREHYHGLPDRVTNYFKFIAHETRMLMAELGVSRLVDLIGRTDLLVELDGFTAKQNKLDLAPLLHTAQPQPGKALYCTEGNPAFDKGLLNKELLTQALPHVEAKQSKALYFDIRNTDRSVGATLSGEIAARHGDQGLASDPIKVYFSGTAGQSFGVWNAGGVELTLTGDANDYVGKGMAGGCIAVRPPVGSAFRSHEASIIGNTCLYGATGGKLFAAGRAGERFAVRNSGAITVVEGIGDNGCEYMTGGIVCVLGRTGVNFGAGMTGGFAYVLDEDGEFRKRVNPELVEVLDVEQLAIHEEHLRGLITEHAQHTGSQRAEEILANWPAWAAKFALVKPKSSDVKALLGHRSRSAAELRVLAQ